jgi:hypothetical protein
MASTPEEQARQTIDAALQKAAWDVQSVQNVNVHAAKGVAIREFPLKSGYGTADYLLYVNGKAAGALEAKKEGATLSGVEIQTEKYSEGMPDELPAHVRPLPFLYQSTGVETYFTNRLDPEPRSRLLFHFHRPDIIAEWLQAEPQADGNPSTLSGRLQHMPPLQAEGLWYAQRTAVTNLEASFAEDRPRALIQMATGSGKTFAAITSIYRLIKHAKAHRVYDLRTNKHFTLKTNRLQRSDLDEFVACFNAENRHDRQPTWSEEHPEGRWRAVTYDELVQRDKCNLDIFWLKDESLEDSASLPDLDVIAADIVEDLRTALEQLEEIAGDLSLAD